MEYTKTLADLPQGKCVATIKNRPWFTQLSVAILGVAILVFAHKFWKLGGLAVLGLVALSYKATKDFIACKLYKDRLVLFNPENQEEVEVVMFDDIKQYRLESKTNSFVQLILNGENEEDLKAIGVATFQAPNLRSRLMKLIPEKDYDYQRLQEVRNLISRGGRKDKKNKDKKENSAVK